jgi:hypothetical protein
MSTLKYYAKTNIGSQKGKSEQLDFKDLRAFHLLIVEPVKNKMFLDFLGRHCAETF